MRRSLLTLAALASCCLLSLTAQAAPPSVVLKVPAGATIKSPNPVEAARQFLALHAKLPSHVMLSSERVVPLQNAIVYRFDQTHMGVPVYSRGAGVAVDSKGRVVLATAHVEENLPSSVTPLVNSATAAVIASNFTGSLVTEHHARLMIVPRAGGARLAWMVLAPAALPSTYAPLTTVDALTGEVLSSVNATRYKNAAKVYLINPVEDNGVTSTVTLPVSDPNDTPDNADIQSYNCVDNGTVVEVTSTKGKRYVHICDLEKNAVADPGTGDFTQYEPAADDVTGDAFSEIQMFYHANKALDYFRSMDGNSGFQLSASDRPLSVVANWMQPPRGVRVDAGIEGGLDASEAAALQELSPYQNAAYVPFVAGDTYWQSLPNLYPNQISGGVLQFGQGVAADYAYDGEVVYHEFTHAVVAATIDLSPYWHLDSQGATPAPGAMNEGLADFFSASISNRAKMGTYAVKDMQVTGLPNMTCIRDLASTVSCPTDMTGEVHADSVPFSSALWTARDQLADDQQKFAYTQAMFTVMNTTSGDVGYEDLAQAFVTTLSNTMSQSVADLAQSEFTARGLLPACNRMLEYTGTPLRSTDITMSYTFTSIGTMYFQVLALDFAPSFFQVKVPITAGTTSLTASFRALAGGYGGSAYQPSYLVSYNTPIVFDSANGFEPNTTTLIDATTPSTSTGDGGTEGGFPEGGSSQVKKYSADIPIPDGTTFAYVMLVNKAASEAYFLDLAFDSNGTADAGTDAADDGPAEGGGEGGSAGAGGSSADSGADGSVQVPDAASDGQTTSDSGQTEQPVAPAANSDDGCGCRVPRSQTGYGAVALGLAAAMWLVRRRRRAA